MAEIIGIFPHWGQAPEPLWREVLGRRLRDLRADRDETLAQTAERAGISPQYLSEIERGRKEPSSEMIAALAGALDTTLADLTLAVTEDLRRLSGIRAGTQSALSRAADTRAVGIGHPATTRSPAPPVALAMAA
ncbi:MAG TPA: helix-turn-helix transcriptional regulator [Trebonia sp.]